MIEKWMILLYFDFRGDDVPGSGICPDYTPGDWHPVPTSGLEAPDGVKLQISIVLNKHPVHLAAILNEIIMLNMYEKQDKNSIVEYFWFWWVFSPFSWGFQKNNNLINCFKHVNLYRYFPTCLFMVKIVLFTGG